MSNTVYDDNLSRNVDVVDDDELNDDSIQHGIDDDPYNDARKGANLGGIGGAVTGAVAGSMVGPLGAVAGAIIGGVAGYVASGAAVGAVDNIDNDNNVSGVGTGVASDIDEDDTYPADPNAYPNNVVTYPTNTAPATTPAYVTPSTTTDAGRYATAGTVGNGVPGIQTGGRDIDGGPDTRGIAEKAADAITGDDIDDKTGEPVMHDAARYDTNTIRNDARGDFNDARYDIDNATYGTRAAANSGIGTGVSRETEVGENVPSLKTGGVANDGTPDTRGIGEKAEDAITGDDVDDKTGKVVDHP